MNTSKYPSPLSLHKLDSEIAIVVFLSGLSTLLFFVHESCLQ